MFGMPFKTADKEEKKAKAKRPVAAGAPTQAAS
jgi:hypothetical protein